MYEGFLPVLEARVDADHIQSQLSGAGDCLLEVGDLQGHMVYSFSVALQESTEEVVRGNGIQRLDEFEPTGTGQVKLDPTEAASRLNASVPKATFQQ